MRTILLLLFLTGVKALQASSGVFSSTPYLPLNDSFPTIDCPPNLTLSTGAFTCTATYIYSVTAADDQAGWTLSQTSGLPSGADFPLGLTTNTFLVTDADGNTASCAFTVTVKDYTPPVAVCDASTTVAIGVDDPLDCFGPAGTNGQPPALGACDFGGITWVKAAAFDDGSYDNCNNIHITIRRLAPFSNAILGLNQLNGHLPCDDFFPDFPSEFERAISEQDSIKFYCTEAGISQKLVLTVYQTEPDGTISVGADGAPIYNQCVISVKVEDKIKPVCTAPAAVSVSCEAFDPSLSTYGPAQLLDNCCLDNSKIYLGQCGLTHTVDYSLFDTVCNRGTLTRLFRAFDCAGNSSSCSQRVVVNYEQNYYIKFPDDGYFSNCHDFGQPTFFGENCELMGVSYEDEVFPIITDACYKLERTWTVINWCTYNPNLPLTYVPNPTPSPITTDTSNFKGPIVSACGTTGPWSPSIIKINPTDTVATNFCTFWNANANGYRYKQKVKIIDTDPPFFLNCPDSSSTFVDNTGNDSNYWNNVFNPSLPAQDLRELETDLSIQAADSCSGGNINIEYLLFLDLDADGVMETVVNSQTYPPVDTVYFGNAFLPNFYGGTPRTFDNRPLPPNQKWRFVAKETYTADSRICELRWNTAQSPNTYVVPALPVGTHKIKWLLQDGCGNENTCEYTFTIQPGSFVCIPPADVVASCEHFDPTLQSYGEPTFSGICATASVATSVNYAQFDTLCSRGTITRIFKALDTCGNSSQCSQKVVVNYLQDYYVKFPDDVIVTNCDGTNNYGEPTFFGEDCELMGVSFSDFSEPGIPDACYKFERTWTVINWCTYNPGLPLINVPNPRPNPINNHPANLPGPIVSACNTPGPWASTMAKVNPTDPTATDFCTFWNADANGYQYKQLVRIIDNTPPVFENCPAPPVHYGDLTQNDPLLWNNVFNPDLPVQDLRELPVDLSVTATDACSGNILRLEYLLFLDLDADGQQETVVSSNNLGASGLGWNNVLYNNINTPNFTGGTSTSFDDRNVSANEKWGFSLQETSSGNNRTARVRWNTAASPGVHVLPELPNGRHKIKWLATDGCGNVTACERFFSIGDTTLVGTHTLEADGFALYQNEPNPFGNRTLIKFQLPESSAATLSVFDAEGRLLYKQTDDYSPGGHTVSLEKAQLVSTGVLFYRLEAGAHMAWRKMVLLR